jgi:2-polyprenyl-3-methyl-5-hydroxy-6-metoxy-1,4-benzoquinol methylase
MALLSPFKKLGLRALMALRLWPHIYFTYSPFKVVEFRELVEDLEWTGRERVLDIGCGSGLQTLLIARHAGHTTGQDINPEFIAQARWYASHVPDCGAIDFEDRPLPEVGWPDHSFDRIFSICVLEHIPEHREILASCTRLLKPGGEMIFSVDTLATITDEALRDRHRAQHHVVQYYTPEDLRAILEEAGFVDIEIRSLFRSDYARLLFERGIRQGFNFGRVGASQLSRRLDEAEAMVAPDAPGIFLAASARTPAAAG